MKTSQEINTFSGPTVSPVITFVERQAETLSADLGTTILSDVMALLRTSSRALLNAKEVGAQFVREMELATSTMTTALRRLEDSSASLATMASAFSGTTPHSFNERPTTSEEPN